MVKIKNKDEEIIEIEVNDRMIDEMLIGLKELKENRGHIHIDIKGNKELLIHHEEDELK